MRGERCATRAAEAGKQRGLGAGRGVEASDELGRLRPGTRWRRGRGGGEGDGKGEGKRTGRREGGTEALGLSSASRGERVRAAQSRAGPVSHLASHLPSHLALASASHRLSAPIGLSPPEHSARLPDSRRRTVPEPPPAPPPPATAPAAAPPSPPPLRHPPPASTRQPSATPVHPRRVREAVHRASPGSNPGPSGRR